MKPRPVFLLALFVAVFNTSIVHSQVISDGWRLANAIKASQELFGAWDIITNLDLDNDGNLEFIYSEDPSVSSALVDKAAGQRIFYYESAGDDSVELRWSFQVPIRNGATNVYTAIAVGDLDQDNLPELYFAIPIAVSDNPPNPKGLYVFEFDGTNFPATPSETWGFNRPDNHEFKAAGLAIGDVDSDGEIELVVQSRGDDAAPGTVGRTMMVVNSSGLDIGLGLGAFAIEFEESIQEGGSHYDPRIVDFDGDGKNEIWIFTWDFFSLAIYEATGQNSYELQMQIDKIYDPLDFGHRRGMRFYDADGDGKLEFYTSGTMADNAPGSKIFYIASIDDVANITADKIVELGGLNLPDEGSAVGDLDGDDLMDFLFVAMDKDNSNQNNMVYRMEYKGSGDLADSTNYDWSLFYKDDFLYSDFRNIEICDLDGDKKTEVIVTNLNALNTNQEIVFILESETETDVPLTNKSAVIKNYELFQNHPNPFNPVTTISFNLKKSEYVTLRVFNQLGEIVQTLVDQNYSEGVHQISWDGRDSTGNQVSTGIYFYSIEAGNFRGTRMMTLIK